MAKLRTSRVQRILPVPAAPQNIVSIFILHFWFALDAHSLASKPIYTFVKSAYKDYQRVVQLIINIISIVSCTVLELYMCV